MVRMGRLPESRINLKALEALKDWQMLKPKQLVKM
jgi:hypothetical protein